MSRTPSPNAGSPKQIPIIGPVTSEVLRAHGLRVDAEAPTQDIQGLVKAVQRLVT